MITGTNHCIPSGTVSVLSNACIECWPCRKNNIREWFCIHLIPRKYSLTVFTHRAIVDGRCWNSFADGRVYALNLNRRSLSVNLWWPLFPQTRLRICYANVWLINKADNTTYFLGQERSNMIRLKSNRWANWCYLLDMNQECGPAVVVCKPLNFPIVLRAFQNFVLVLDEEVLYISQTRLKPWLSGRLDLFQQPTFTRIMKHLKQQLLVKRISRYERRVTIMHWRYFRGYVI